MSSDASKYETFLRRTRKRVQRPATDHDYRQIGAGQTALLDRIDELRALKKRVTNAIRSRVDILEGEERDLRKLSKAKQKDVFCDALVLIDSRQGGVILVRDAETGEVLAGPTPLSAGQREVFASTKSQPGLFGDPVAVNEDLAKKLNLMEYLADEPPITIEQRVANALDAGDLPDELKEAILALDEEDEAEPKAKKEKAPKEPKKKGKKAKGEAFTNPTPPAAATPPTSPVASSEDEPGPATVEPDRDELPKHPPRARPPLDDTPPEDEPSIGDLADAEGMAGDSAATHAPEPAVEEDDDDGLPDFGADAAGDAADESPRAREYDTRSEDAEDDLTDEERSGLEAAETEIRQDHTVSQDVVLGTIESMRQAEMDAADDAPPDSADAPGEPIDDVDPSEMPEPEDVPADAEITTDAIPEMDGPAETSAEPAGEPVDASPEPEPAPVALPIVKPVEPEEEAAAKAAETPAPKKGGRKKKGEADPPEPDATATPVAPPVTPTEPAKVETPAPVPVPATPAAGPTPALANHFGLKTEKMALDAVAAFRSMAKRTVFFANNLAADVETEAKTKFSATMRAAVVPVFEHLAEEKQITRRKLPNGDFAYYDAPAIAKSAKDLTPERVEAAIAARLKK